MEKKMAKRRCILVLLNVFSALMALGSVCAQESLPDLSYGSWGLDLKAADPAIPPGDDFFTYSNGAWLEGTSIPSDKSRVTLRALMTDRTEARLRALLETAAQNAGHAPNDINGKVGAFYKAFMDEDSVEALGAKPVTSIMATIQAMSTREALGAMMGRATYDFAGSFFDASIYVDAKNPSQYAVYLNQGGLGLPDRAYYTNADPEFSKAKAVYQAYVERLLTLVGWSDPGGNAKRIIAMETHIAEAHWPKAETRELEKTYNPMTVADLEVLAPGFPWQPYLAEAKLASTARVIIAEKSAFPKIAEIFATTPIATLQAWQAYKVLSRAAPYLSKPFSDAHFEMYEKTLLGQENERARWKRGVFAVSGDLDGNSDPLGHLGWAVGQLYVEQHFTSAMRDQVETLVSDIVDAFRARLKKNDWMSSVTKAEALEKLDSFIIQVGYPSTPQRDYSCLIVSDDDLVGNVRRAASLDWDFFVNRLPNPVDRNDWPFTPQVNNAANAFYLRSLTFPAALLQAPLYDTNADAAVNYGAFGAYAGHEITHGFDDQGHKIDAKGRLRNWWTMDEAETFEARAAELGKQYSAFEPLAGFHVNGQLTMGENIADLGGLTLALDAYHASLQGKPAPVIDGLTGDQRVFFGWAQAWRGKLSESALRNQVTTDPHAPRQYRVNGVVRNINEWYEAFGVKPGEKLYLMPENRVHIW
jgi:putative endopeptidase